MDKYPSNINVNFKKLDVSAKVYRRLFFIMCCNLVVVGFLLSCYYIFNIYLLFAY